VERERKRGERKQWGFEMTLTFLFFSIFSNPAQVADEMLGVKSFW
jgi:hypothetical protein